MLDVTRGITRNAEIAEQLANALQASGTDGSLYIGYPVIATADESITVDALLVSPRHGPVAFLLIKDSTSASNPTGEVQSRRDEMDRLYVSLQSELTQYQNLRQGRVLAFEIHVVLVFPPMALASAEPAYGTDVIDLDQIPEWLSALPPMEPQYFRHIEAALQRVNTIRPPKRRQSARTPESRGSILKELEISVANLDRWQKRAAIEAPAGPQRIRGLAGSGKTVVLALKAAYLHTQFPDWTIAVTFHSRALYQQFQDLIRRFTFEHQKNEPDWEKLLLLHSWGGSERDGLYTQIAGYCQLPPRNYLYARDKFGAEDAFDGVCSELLAASADISLPPIFDAVLIDEAQDLPSSFFRLVYRFTKEPKRIVWAYDDLQKLSEVRVPDLGEIFGTRSTGEPLVALLAENQDIVLPRCYRNPPWTIAAAHALGLGVYRPGGLVQHFDDPALWTEVGYTVAGGELRQGCSVVLERERDSAPGFFWDLLNSNDALSWHQFETPQAQASWLASSIERNLSNDELEPDDILVVLPDPYTAKSEAAPIRQALVDRGIRSHLVGVTSTQDEVFRKGSVALAHIFRSKGNEAAMVYVAGAQRCLAGSELITRRNMLFTAVTRSRAWVRVTGWGPAMGELAKELDSVAERGFRLEFRVPTESELSEMRLIHRDLSPPEREGRRRLEGSMKTVLDALKRGDVRRDQLPWELREELVRLLSEPHEQDG